MIKKVSFMPTEDNQEFIDEMKKKHYTPTEIMRWALDVLQVDLKSGKVKPK